MSEELKVILDLLEAAGIASSNLFIFYVIIELLRLIIIAGCFTFIAVYLGKLSLDSVSDSNNLRSLRDLMDINLYGPVSKSDICKMQRWIEKAKEDKKK